MHNVVLQSINVLGFILDLMFLVVTFYRYRIADYCYRPYAGNFFFLYALVGFVVLWILEFSAMCWMVHKSPKNWALIAFIGDFSLAIQLAWIATYAFFMALINNNKNAWFFNLTSDRRKKYYDERCATFFGCVYLLGFSLFSVISHAVNIFLPYKVVSSSKSNSAVEENIAQLFSEHRFLIIISIFGSVGIVSVISEVFFRHKDDSERPFGDVE